MQIEAYRGNRQKGDGDGMGWERGGERVRQTDRQTDRETKQTDRDHRPYIDLSHNTQLQKHNHQKQYVVVKRL